MGGFKRLCLAVWSLAGVFTLAALGLTWVGPWTDVASALMVINGYWMALEVCFCITAAGLVVTLLRALFSRRVKTVEVTTVDGGVISVTRAAARVSVSAKPRGHVRVHVRVLPHESVDVVEKGAQLHEELCLGLAAVCGDKLEDVSLEFVEPEAVTFLGLVRRSATDTFSMARMVVETLKGMFTGRFGLNDVAGPIGRRRRRGRHCRRCRRARRG